MAMHQGHKEHRNHRDTGGVNEAAEDLKDKPEARTNAKNIDSEAEERKRGGKAEPRKEHKATGGKVHHEGMHHGEEHHHPSCKCKRCRGGRAARKRGGGVHEGFGLEGVATERAHGGIVHHEKMEHMKHAKHIGKVEGHHAKAHLGRAPRKSGGRTGSDSMPYSSARRGIEPRDHKVESEME